MVRKSKLAGHIKNDTLPPAEYLTEFIFLLDESMELLEKAEDINIPDELLKLEYNENLYTVIKSNVQYIKDIYKYTGR